MTWHRTLTGLATVVYTSEDRPSFWGVFVSLVHRAMLRRATASRPYVSPSVTLRYRGHIGYNTSKIIPRLISLGRSLSADPKSSLLIYSFTFTSAFMQWIWNSIKSKVIGCRQKHAASRGFPATARLSCFHFVCDWIRPFSSESFVFCSVILVRLSQWCFRRRQSTSLSSLHWLLPWKWRCHRLDMRPQANTTSSTYQHTEGTLWGPTVLSAANAVVNHLTPTVVIRMELQRSILCQTGSSRALFVIFDIRALWRSVLSVRVPGCQKLQMTGSTRSGTGLLYSCTHGNSGRQRVKFLSQSWVIRSPSLTVETRPYVCQTHDKFHKHSITWCNRTVCFYWCIEQLYNKAKF